MTESGKLYYAVSKYGSVVVSIVVKSIESERKDIVGRENIKIRAGDALMMLKKSEYPGWYIMLFQDRMVFVHKTNLEEVSNA